MLATERFFVTGWAFRGSLSGALTDTGSPVMGAFGDEAVVIGDADQRPAVAGYRDDGAGAEDRVDGAPFEAELGQVAAGQQRRWIVETLGGGRTGHAMPDSSARR